MTTEQKASCWIALVMVPLALVLAGLSVGSAYWLGQSTADPIRVCVNGWECFLPADAPLGTIVYVGPESGINEAYTEWKESQ